MGEGLERATRELEPALELEIYSEPLGTPRLPLLWLTATVQPGARGQARAVAVLHVTQVRLGAPRDTVVASPHPDGP